jgi:hypothetical protein
MTKAQAHAILNRCRETHVSLALTNAALERTGDICGISSQSLRFDGLEPQDHRPCQVHDADIQKGFSYSAYLDKKENT